MTGIESLPHQRIPEEWSPRWFAEFIRDVLSLIDIHNAVGDGIVITGPPSEFATLTAAGILFNQLQQIAADRILGRLSTVGDIEELTGTEATTLIDAFIGDSGAGGTKGLVPAPGAGDTAADKFLFADGSFAAIQNAASGIRGLVEEAANVADAVASTVSVTSADATDLPTVITLANELKADVNTLVTDVNAIVTQVNAILASIQTAGQMA